MDFHYHVACLVKQTAGEHTNGFNGGIDLPNILLWNDNVKSAPDRSLF